MPETTCKHCNKTIPDGARFCPSCGKSPSSVSVLKVIGIVVLGLVSYSSWMYVLHFDSNEYAARNAATQIRLPAPPHPVVVAESEKQSTIKGYQFVDLTDLKTDLKELENKKVQTLGALQILGEMVFLKSDLMDVTPVTVSYSKLPREDRKKLLASCQHDLCPVRISGLIKAGVLGLELRADNIQWR